MLFFRMHAPRGAVCLFFLVTLSPLVGQETPTPSSTQASISGAVMDQTGAVLPGARVVLSRGTEKGRETTTDEKGVYVFSGF